MAETSTIFGFMKYVSATDILSDFKKTVDSHFVNSLKGHKECPIYQMPGSLLPQQSYPHVSRYLHLQRNE